MSEIVAPCCLLHIPDKHLLTSSLSASGQFSSISGHCSTSTNFKTYSYNSLKPNFDTVRLYRSCTGLLYKRERIKRPLSFLSITDKNQLEIH